MCRRRTWPHVSPIGDGFLTGLLARRPGAFGRPQAKRLAKMGDRGLSKIGKAKQCLVRRFAHLSDSLQAGREQCVFYPRWESNFTGWCLIRKIWRRLKLTHFFALSPDLDRPPLIEIPSALAFRSIVLTDVLNFAAISDVVAPFTAIAITWRSSFQVNRAPGLRFPAIPPPISSPSARSRRGGGPNSFPIRVHSVGSRSASAFLFRRNAKPTNPRTTRMPPATINQCGYCNSERMLNCGALR